VAIRQMKLRTAGASPFSRKVMAFAHEAGIWGLIETVETNYEDPESGLWNENPLGRVPTLVVTNNNILQGSSVICQFLGSLSDKRELIPSEGDGRWRALNGEALSDGLCEAAIAIQRELSRASEIRSQLWIDRQKNKVTKTINWINTHWELPSNIPSIDLIALSCTLNWIDYRLHNELGAWHQANNRLSNWLRDFSKRPSMLQTRPPPSPG
jgi:glutathione S-transferase